MTKFDDILAQSLNLAGVSNEELPDDILVQQVGSMRVGVTDSTTPPVILAPELAAEPPEEQQEAIIGPPERNPVVASEIDPQDIIRDGMEVVKDWVFQDRRCTDTMAYALAIQSADPEENVAEIAHLTASKKQLQGQLESLRGKDRRDNGIGRRSRRR